MPANGALPKYQRVFDQLREEIASGRYKPGEKLPSEAALVKRFGASRITVGRAVGDLRKEGFVERRAGSGTYVRRKRSGDAVLSFGLLIPNLGQMEIFAAICQGMADASGDHVLLWGTTSQGSASRGEEALTLCRQYIDRGVSGVFFAPIERTPEAGEINRQIITQLDEARIPVVLLDRCFSPYPQRSRYDLVGIDNRRAGYLITEHLLKLGCRRIAFVNYPLSAATVAARIGGYQEALLAYDVPLDAQLVQQLDPADTEAVQRVGRAADAFICANDATAGRLMRTLLGLGYRIPASVRVAGFDDVRYASLLPVPLTTIRQPCRDIGMAAIGVMQERISYPQMATRDVLLSCELVVRDSCGARRVNLKSDAFPD